MKKTIIFCLTALLLTGCMFESGQHYHWRGSGIEVSFPSSWEGHYTIREKFAVTQLTDGRYAQSVQLNVRVPPQYGPANSEGDLLLTIDFWPHDELLLTEALQHDSPLILSALLAERDDYFCTATWSDAELVKEASDEYRALHGAINKVLDSVSLEPPDPSATLPQIVESTFFTAQNGMVISLPALADSPFFAVDTANGALELLYRAASGEELCFARYAYDDEGNLKIETDLDNPQLITHMPQPSIWDVHDWAQAIAYGRTVWPETAGG